MNRFLLYSINFLTIYVIVLVRQVVGLDEREVFGLYERLLRLRFDVLPIRVLRKNSIITGIVNCEKMQDIELSKHTLQFLPYMAQLQIYH